ncbi:pantoate--beta-alanine ligase [Ghiorsea bivora]|uniref:pantoate--beta-alanine ligase n=1 Tax=Ghiorsea bivora TaxID=1485545 RepID=UPI00056FDC76|nr:pantoate--beta-alanine ligase [Ghiorsea bivora]
MKVITSISELQHILANYHQEQVAFVPTMGCLHQGHLSLIRKAKRLADIVVVSIYVNPLQFNDKNDLKNYPKPFETDIQLCQEEGVDFVFHPENLYANTPMQVALHVNNLSQSLCGLHRPGHFDGMITVVNILFNIIRPDLAIFGEKDFQQLSIIRHMVADLHMPIDIIAGETVREQDGLALSSRNRHLTAEQRRQAAAIPQALQAVIQTYQTNKAIPSCLAAGQNILDAHGIKPDYFGVYDEQHLQAVNSLTTHDPIPARVFIAATIGSTRLIDNMPLITPPAKDTQP